MRTKLKNTAMLGLLLVGGALYGPDAHSAVIGGVEFPQGVRSFADVVVAYVPGNPAPTVPYQVAANALGVPDFTVNDTCPNQGSCSYVSLGRGGSITLRFTDNALTGSGSTNVDLWIFEVGPDVEDTFVEVSQDGVTWASVGNVSGGRRGIDIDAYGFGPSARLSYVRLTDDPNEGEPTGVTVGADIDAVGAIASALPQPKLDIRVSQVELCWDTSTNLLYQLEYREALSTNGWLPFGSQILGSGRRFCTNDQILLGQPRRFYQLSLTNAP